MNYRRVAHAKKIALAALAALATVASTGCIEPGEPVYGESFTPQMFEVYDPMVGVFPSEAVLDDPNNPFAIVGSGRDTRFQIEVADETNVRAFYSWASWLVREPTGESQFYAAANLAEIWFTGNASQKDLPVVREMAIAGFQTVLDDFPDAATFDETGTIRFELLTPSYVAITELGGTPEGGWVLVTDSAGIPRAVRQ